MKKQLFYILLLISCTACANNTFSPCQLALFLHIHKNDENLLIQKYAKIIILDPKKTTRDYMVAASKEKLVTMQQKYKEYAKHYKTKKYDALLWQAQTSLIEAMRDYSEKIKYTTEQIQNFVDQKMDDDIFFQKGLDSLQNLEKKA